MHSTQSETPQKPIAIKVWSALQLLLNGEKSPHLSRERFVLQKDAFVRLADEDVESDVPFLTYQYHEITSDETLDFSLLFFGDFLAIEIGPIGLTMPYETLGFDSTKLLGLSDDELSGANPETIAENILLTVKLLLSGGIAGGCTWRRGELVAFETFLLGLEPKPYPIGISSQFSLLKRSGDEYTVKQNRVLEHMPKVPAAFPLLPPIINGTRVKRGRDVESFHDLSPLTKARYEELSTEADLHEFAGKSQDESAWHYIYRTPEFWLVAAPVIGGILILSNAPFMPAFLKSDYMFPLYIIAAWTIIPGATGLLLGRRQVKINAGEQPWTYRLETWLSGFGNLRAALILLHLLLLPVVLLAPLWSPKTESAGLYNTLEMAGRVPMLLILPLLSLIALTALALSGLYQRRPVRAALGVLSLAYLGLLIAANGLWMNTTASAPEPPGLALGTVLLVPLLLAGLSAAATVQKPKTAPHRAAKDKKSSPAAS